MAGKDGIQKYDIISKGALDTWEDFIRLAKDAHAELLEIVKVGPKLNQDLNKAEWAEQLSASVKEVASNCWTSICVGKKRISAVNCRPATSSFCNIFLYASLLFFLLLQPALILFVLQWWLVGFVVPLLVGE